MKELRRPAEDQIGAEVEDPAWTVLAKKDTTDPQLLHDVEFTTVRNSILHPALPLVWPLALLESRLRLFG
jgi:hypothetical protein